MISFIQNMYYNNVLYSRCKIFVRYINKNVLQTSYSTEELNQEMANLEGLMKDLSAITASEFQC